jgi:hypothetical protein
MDPQVCGICFEYGHSMIECKEDKADFDLVGPIAAFIGARLQHPRPPCNGRNPRVSTIHVDQYKEKFWNVRIYCALASTEEVEAKWAEFGREGQPDDAFYAMCLMHDARHYRRCYLEMVSLVPRLRKRICNAADYSVLLQDNADVACEQLVQRHESWNAYPDNQRSFLATWRVASLDALKERLRLIYDERAGQKAMLAEL